MDNLINNFENLSLNLIKSSRKKKDGSDSFLLIDDNYFVYKSGYQCKDGKITWRCNNTQYPNCLGSVSTIGHKKPITVLLEHEHNQTIKTKVKEVTSQMRTLAETQPDTRPRKIILESQKNVEEEVAAHLPSYNAARLVCSRARIDPYAEYEIPENLKFVLHENFKITSKCDKFLVYDETIDDNNRIFIFSTERNYQLLSDNSNWLCDGTFDAASSIFKQLFTCHVIKNGKNLPLAYALLCNKLQETYHKVFEFLSSKVSCAPVSVISDFELAITNSFDEVFPTAEIYGCFFYLKKSIWRKIQENGLSVAYCDLTTGENLIRLYCKMLASLAFVPRDDVVDAFVIIQDKAPKELKKLYTYFEENYIGTKRKTKVPSRKKPRFTIDWNCYDRTKAGLPRTNNNLEGWHNGLQSTIKSHPHLLSLIDSLKLEQGNMENNYVKLSTGIINKR